MSWLNEIEDSIAKRKAEQEGQKREEQLVKEQEERKIKSIWEAYEGQVVKELIDRWRRLEIDSILNDIRDSLWPTSRISSPKTGFLEVVLPTEDAEITLVRVVKTRKGKGLFASSKTETSWGGRWTKGENARPNATEPQKHILSGSGGQSFADVMATSGVDPKDIKNPYLRAKIYHYEYVTRHWDDGGAEEARADLHLSLYEDCIMVGKDQIILDKIDVNELKEKMIPILERKVLVRVNSD